MYAAIVLAGVIQAIETVHHRRFTYTVNATEGTLTVIRNETGETHTCRAVGPQVFVGELDLPMDQVEAADAMLRLHGADW